MRVYVPATLADLEQLVASGRVNASTAFAVTDALAAAYGPGEDEEYEHSAMSAAAAASRLAQGDTWRRVVIAADVADVTVIDAIQGEVRLAEALSLSEVVSVHVDQQPSSGELPDDDAADLQWFATQELDDLVKGEQQ